MGAHAHEKRVLQGHSAVGAYGHEADPGIYCTAHDRRRPLSLRGWRKDRSVRASSRKTYLRVYREQRRARELCIDCGQPSKSYRCLRHRLMRSKAGKKQLRTYALWLVLSANYVQEASAANVFNNGFTTETTTFNTSFHDAFKNR